MAASMPPAIRILLVEDNPGDARLIREHLSEAEGTFYELEHVERLREALLRLDHGALDVVLLDLSLSDSQGLDTVREAHRRAPQIPIVVLTGWDDETQAVRAVQEGAQDYLIKGKVDCNLLVRSMRYAIERHRMLAELEQARRLLAAGSPRAMQIRHPALRCERAKTMKTTMSANARANQVMAYWRWLLGKDTRVLPPMGRPPGTGVASASMTKGATGMPSAWPMADGSRVNHMFLAGSSAGVNQPRGSGARRRPTTVCSPSIGPQMLMLGS